MGRVGAAYGVHGWLKIHSDAIPADNILHYQPWKLALNRQTFERQILDSRAHGLGLVVKFEGCVGREEAQTLVGAEILVRRDALPTLDSDEYYWRDLIGLKVTTTQAMELGVVEQLLETGANDVLVVRGEREHLVPFVVPDYVKEVDLERGAILVEWDPSF